MAKSNGQRVATVIFQIKGQEKLKLFFLLKMTEISIEYNFRSEKSLLIIKK